MIKQLLSISILFISLKGYSQESKEVENLGPDVNSIYAELRPTISADGKTLYFIRESDPNNTMMATYDKAQDIWYSELGADGKWGKAKHAGLPLNTRKSNTVFWVSPDGNRILIRGGFNKDEDFTAKGFSMCYKTKDGWSEPEQVNVKNYAEISKGKSSGVVMADNAKTMLFYLTEEKDGKIFDIYVSFLKKGNDWTEPKSIGKDINTKEYTETSPFLASDGITLYFSSNRPGGLGSNDIYMSKRLDDTWEKWSEPVNLGAPINTPNWDAFFAIDANSEFAYMVSSFKSIGKTDIIRIPLKQKEKPNPVVLVYGKVFNAKTKQPISSSLLYETLPGGENAGNAFSSPVDGSYKIVLPYGKNYSFRATAEKFVSVSENLNLDSTASYKEINRDLYLVPIEVGQTIRLNSIFFDFGNANLRKESFPELDRLVDVLKENSKMEIELSGHTDNVGADDKNLKLSDERAKAVKDYLLSKGIGKNKVVSKGYGESKPTSTNDTEQGRQLNRRVEFTILKN